MTTHNWEEMGIEWEASPVARGTGAAKVTFKTPAQIPVLADMDKARKALGDDPILAAVNGTSWRVSAQDVCRGMLEKNSGTTTDAMREAVYNRLRGLRNAASVRTVTVTKRPMPDGTMYTGNDETEYRAQYMAQLVEAGVASVVAQGIAKSLAW